MFLAAGHSQHLFYVITQDPFANTRISIKTNALLCIEGSFVVDIIIIIKWHWIWSWCHVRAHTPKDVRHITAQTPDCVPSGLSGVSDTADYTASADVVDSAGKTGQNRTFLPNVSLIYLFRSYLDLVSVLGLIYLKGWTGHFHTMIS